MMKEQNHYMESVFVPLSGLASVNHGNLRERCVDKVFVPLSGLASVNDFSCYDGWVSSEGTFSSPYRG